MGKGDQRTRRGKIKRGTSGKSRPKQGRSASRPKKEQAAEKPARR